MAEVVPSVPSSPEVAPLTPATPAAVESEPAAAIAGAAAGSTSAVGGATAWPIIARAQQRATLPAIGFFGAGSAGSLADRIEGANHGCKLRVNVDPQDIIVGGAWDGNNGGCAVFASRLQ